MVLWGGGRRIYKGGICGVAKEKAPAGGACPRPVAFQEARSVKSKSQDWKAPPAGRVPRRGESQTDQEIGRACHASRKRRGVSQSPLDTASRFQRWLPAFLMSGMRQRLTKKQWFILFNCAAVAALYICGDVHLRADYVVPDLLALIAVNAAALISAGRFKDWKK